MMIGHQVWTPHWFGLVLLKTNSYLQALLVADDCGAGEEVQSGEQHNQPTSTSRFSAIET